VRVEAEKKIGALSQLCLRKHSRTLRRNRKRSKEPSLFLSLSAVEPLALPLCSRQKASAPGVRAGEKTAAAAAEEKKERKKQGAASSKKNKPSLSPSSPPSLSPQPAPQKPIKHTHRGRRRWRSGSAWWKEAWKAEGGKGKRKKKKRSGRRRRKSKESESCEEELLFLKKNK